MRVTRYAVPAALATALATSGCGLLPGTGTDDGGPRRPPAAAAKPGDLTGGRHYRTGWFGKPENTASFDVHRVERYASYSVLYMDVYTGPGATSFVGWFGQDANSSDFGQFALLDPVGKKSYSSLRSDTADGAAFGTRIENSRHPGIAASITPRPGVRYPVQVYFPPVPAGVRQLTVVGPGTLGEMTGIPVLDAGKARAPVPKANDNSAGQPAPKRGQAYFYPVHAPAGRIWSQTQDLHDYSEGLAKSTSSGGGEEKLALRTDVLFAFDQANLSPKATAVLDAAINETRAKADPAKPPITITGYTDAKGNDAYNKKLSERRAAAVQKYISAKLGTTYRYQATGNGEADPVAANTHGDGSDNPAGRAKNRRVEISYKIKHTTPKVATPSSAAPAPGTAGAAAPFHNGDGPVIGTVTAQDPITAGQGARLGVHPFYRDGAYMVGVYTLRSFGGGLSDVGAASDAWWTSNGTIKAMSGASFGGITAINPATKDRYYEVRAGDFVDGSAGFVEGAYQISLPGSRDTRIFVYYPAPPANVTEMDVDVAGKGIVRNVPVR